MQQNEKRKRQRVYGGVRKGLRNFFDSLGEPLETMVCRLHNRKAYRYEKFAYVTTLHQAFSRSIEQQLQLQFNFPKLLATYLSLFSDKSEHQFLVEHCQVLPSKNDKIV